jgi:uncharacterized protein
LPRSMFWTPGRAVNELNGPGAVEAISDYVDRGGVSAAILNSGAALGISSIANPRFAMEVAKAANDWLRAEWLERDPRFFGSIVVSGRDGDLAAAEIDRLGEDPRFAQVQLAYPTARLGERQFDRLYAAAAEHGLPVQLLAGAGYAGANRGIAGVGHPATRMEYDADVGLACAPHLMSMLASGVFERHPSLAVIISGFGLAWMASFGLSVRSAAVRAGIGGGELTERFAAQVSATTTRAELDPDPDRLRDLLATVPELERQIIYGSGDQRPDPPDPSTVLAALPSEWHRAVRADNASARFARLAVVPA